MAATIPPHLVNGLQAIKIGCRQEEKLKIATSSVQLHIDLKGHIVYWIHDITNQSLLETHKIKSFLYVQDITDVRYDTAAIRYVPENIRSSASAGQVFTIITNVDMSHPIYTTFILPKSSYEIVKSTSDSLFQLAYKTRRSHHGLLFHVEKRLAPLICLSKSQKGQNSYISFDDFARHLLPSRTNVEQKELTKHLGRIFRVLNSWRERSYRSETLRQYYKSGFIPIDHISDTSNLIDLILKTAMGEGARCLWDLFEKVATDNSHAISKERMIQFLNQIQGAPRRNEKIHPPVNNAIFDRNLQILGYHKVETIPFKMFVHILWSDWMADTNDAMFKLKESTMDRPITHYHINSSHNTYCSGLQTGIIPAMFQGKRFHQHARAEVEIYRQTLLSGCRCIELDCWNGVNEPVVTHGPTAILRMNEISLRECCIAISETAFKTSAYPVLISIENHLNPVQQKKMVEMFREIFGEHLLTEPLSSHPLVEGQDPPSPVDLMYKILIKAKKAKTKDKDAGMKRERSLGSVSSKDDKEITAGSISVCSEPGNLLISLGAERIRQNSFSVQSLDSMIDDTSFTEEKKAALEVLESLGEDVKHYQMHPAKEEEASSDLSQIVNYLEADKPPKDWGLCDNRYFVMCSIDDESVTKLFKQQTRKAIRYNRRKMTRVYPHNLRHASDNFDPMKAWLIGTQMAALNFQTNCPRMLLNHALFELNGSSGYVLKSKVLRDHTLEFDPHATTQWINQIIPAKLKCRIITGHFLSSACTDQNEPLECSVTVEVINLDKKIMYRTKTAMEHILYTKFSNEVKQNETMTFSKLLLPEMTFVHFIVERKVGVEMVPFAHRILQLDSINNGYRYVILRTAGNQNLGPACLFVHFEVIHDMPSHHMLRRDLADPFAQDKKNEAIRRALADPLNMLIPAPDEEPEEEVNWEKKKDIMRRETRLQLTQPSVEKTSKFPAMRSLLNKWKTTK